MTEFVTLKSKRTQTNDTSFILHNIDNKDLDRRYCLNEINLKNQKPSSQIQLPKSSTKSSFGTIFDRSKQPFQRESDESSRVALTSNLQQLGLSYVKHKNLPTIITHKDMEAKKIAQQLIVCPDSSQERTLDSCHCWYCRLCIPSLCSPLSLPYEFNQQDKFTCEGIYCSFNCMKAYLNEYGMYHHKYKNSSIYLATMYTKIFGTDHSYLDIKPSPSWKFQRRYGGHLSDDEYRAEIQLNSYQSLQQFCKQSIKLEISSELFVMNKK